MFQFFVQFLRNPRKVGAVAPSSQYLAKKMMKPIDFSNAQCIVEFGPGTGSFTKELLRCRNEQTMLILIEQNPCFCEQLQNRYGREQNVRVIQGSAEHVREYLALCGFSHADYIISGLPFTTLPGEVSSQIFVNARRVLGDHGAFITFQYSMLKKKLFGQYFAISDTLWEVRNLPPACVMVMKADIKTVQADSRTGTVAEEKGSRLDGRLYFNCR